MSKIGDTDDEEKLRTLLIRKRKEAGLTQAELARRLGTYQSFVSKYETGERRIDVLEFSRIAKALGLEPVELLRALLE